MKIALTTLGCKLNFAETIELANEIKSKTNIKIVDFSQTADLYIVNCCAITKKASVKTRHKINAALKKGPVLATGCLEITEQPKNPKYTYIKEKKNVLKFIQKKYLTRTTISQNEYKKPIKQINAAKNSNRTRYFLKIQTGCNNHCTFCIIPYFRGQPKSINPDLIVQKINMAIKQDYKEVILTGININKYKYNNTTLEKLIHKILVKTKIPRIRLSSLDPSGITKELIELFKNNRLCPHAHLSLQSGCDKILQLMGRKYSTKQYFNLTHELRKINSNFGITTDIIVGFPFETTKNFQTTYNFARKIGFNKIHVFPYSPRQHTPAYNFKESVSLQNKKQRTHILLKLSDKLSKQFKKKLISTNANVLIETYKNGYYMGLTENYIKIRTKSKENINNSIVSLTLKSDSFV